MFCEYFPVSGFLFTLLILFYAEILNYIQFIISFRDHPSKSLPNFGHLFYLLGDLWICIFHSVWMNFCDRCKFTFCKWMTSYSSTICRKDYILSLLNVISSAILSKEAGYMHVDLFLGSLFCSLAHTWSWLL
jgi:hypothetical protein